MPECRLESSPSWLFNTTLSLHFVNEFCWGLLFPSPLFLSLSRFPSLSVLSRILWTSPGQLSSLAANDLASRLSDVIMLYSDAWSGPVFYDYVKWLAVWGKLLSGLYSVRVSWSLLISHEFDTNERNSTKWRNFLGIMFVDGKALHWNIFG